MHSSKLSLFLFSSTILLISVNFVTPKPPNGFSLQLIHRDSPESPFYPGTLTQTQRTNRLAQLSETRANFLHNLNTYPQSLKLKLATDAGIHLVKIQIGTPAIPLYLLPDTGSNLVWTQCEPCTHRFNQTSPIYNSAASHTFKKLPCQHPFCHNNNSTFKCRNGECVYKETYLGGSVTEGIVASDTFENSFNLNFGCSKNNQNFDGFKGKFGGVLGLSLSPISLLQQLGHVTQRRFSYCLVPFYGEANVSSFLRFGSEINTHGRTFKSTPIVSPPNADYYYMDLRDISVEGKRMEFPANMFAIKRDRSGGCFIDSGTTFTHIVEPAYKVVLKAFQNYFGKYGIRPIRLPHLHYDLCYRNKEEVEFAVMTFHFQGADFEVEPENLYVDIEKDDAFCLGLTSSPSLTIIGAMQQVDTRFIYDAAARRIYFSPENCIDDR
ncbi:aspartic proteinase CDR1-like [Euphorbia lathyris]|uniref:aspartic proteinase CDR1-like n=1 Tax=Euphorbia lathyris TaxID=212925 RepID=UPI00331345EC